VEYGTLLGEVDAFAAEHGSAHALQIRFARQLHQVLHGFGGDPVFRVVEQHVAAAQGQLVEAIGVVGERGAHVERAHEPEVLFQGFPGGQLFGQFHGRAGVRFELRRYHKRAARGLLRKA